MCAVACVIGARGPRVCQPGRRVGVGHWHKDVGSTTRMTSRQILADRLAYGSKRMFI